MRRFVLVRSNDVSGVSGTGQVAAGVELPSGRVVLEWRPPVMSITIHASIADVEAVHGHGGNTILFWIDEEAA